MISTLCFYNFITLVFIFIKINQTVATIIILNETLQSTTKSIRNIEARIRKPSDEIHRNQEDAYNEIINKIVENEFLTVKVPPSLNNHSKSDEPVNMQTTKIPTTSVFDEIQALKLLEDNTTRPLLSSGNIVQLNVFESALKFYYFKSKRISDFLKWEVIVMEEAMVCIQILKIVKILLYVMLVAHFEQNVLLVQNGIIY
jgi:hypothetical protein